MLHPTYLPFTANQLRQRRHELYLSGKKLDALAGQKPGTVSSIERGQLNPSVEAAKAICDALKQVKVDHRAPEAIRPRRISLRRSQRELAEEAGVERKSVGNLERGFRRGRRLVSRKPPSLKPIIDALDRLEQAPHFADELKQQRECAGLSQGRLAKLCYLSTTTIWEIEKGRTKPRDQTKRKLCEALKVVGPLIPLDKVRAARIRLRLSALELARQANVCHSTLERAEKGEHLRPSRHQRLHEALKKLAQQRKVDWSDLISQDAPETSLGRSLKRRREALDQSRADLAKNAGVCPACVWQIEEDKCHPYPRTLRAIEQALENAENGTAKLHGHEASRLYPNICNKSARARWRKRRASEEPRYPLSHLTKRGPGSCRTR